MRSSGDHRGTLIGEKTSSACGIKGKAVQSCIGAGCAQRMRPLFAAQDQKFRSFLWLDQQATTAVHAQSHVEGRKYLLSNGQRAVTKSLWPAWIALPFFSLLHPCRWTAIGALACWTMPWAAGHGVANETALATPSPRASPAPAPLQGSCAKCAPVCIGLGPGTRSCMLPRRSLVHSAHGAGRE